MIHIRSPCREQRNPTKNLIQKGTLNMFSKIIDYKTNLNEKEKIIYEYRKISRLRKH